MKMIKKLAVIGMVLSLAGAMVGCGDTPESQQVGSVINATTETARVPSFFLPTVGI